MRKPGFGRAIGRVSAFACGVALLAAGASAAMARDTTTIPSEVIPFTSATVTPGSAAGAWAVRWTAPGVETVKVEEGGRAASTTKTVGHAGARGSVTVTLPVGLAHPWFKLVPNVGEALVVTERELGLSSDLNFRDVGGYRTSDGQWVRMGVLYRAAALKLDPADAATVNTLGITSDFDLRTAAETVASPDVVPVGAKYLELSVFGASIPGVSAGSAQQSEAQMETWERDFVTLPSAKTAYKTLFTDIADGTGAAVYHCSAGKDRTGWASAVLLTLLGVPKSTVMSDYLLSNKYYLDSPSVQAELTALGSAASTIEPYLAVAPAYLQAGFSQVAKEYGSMESYALHGIGLSKTTIAKLKSRLLVGAPL